MFVVDDESGARSKVVPCLVLPMKGARQVTHAEAGPRKERKQKAKQEDPPWNDGGFAFEFDFPGAHAQCLSPVSPEPPEVQETDSEKVDQLDGF